MSEQLSVEVVVDARNVVGECPVWEPATQRLTWLDIPRGEVHRLEPAAGRYERAIVGDVAAAIVSCRDGGYLVAREADVVVVDESLAVVATLTELELAERERLNDGKCDPAGRFWVGTAADRASHRSGALYRIEASGEASVVQTGVSLSNGLGWSPDSSVLYYVDSPTHRVDRFAFELETGEIELMEPLVQLEERDGLPDGLCVDAEGGVWIALWGGWQVRRYRPDGTLDAVVSVPAAQVTSCTFGGPQLSDLYITSARSGLDESDLEEQPLAGALFRCRPGVAGLPPTPFERPPTIGAT
jgi:sugar lactone lactonase YvrE